MGLLPDLPLEEQDPWYADRQAFDLAVRNEIENLLASKVYVDAAITALVNSSPAALDTLNELAAALGNDANFAASITTQLAAKAPLASPTFTGDPKAPTPAANDNDTSIATTAFVAERALRYASVFSTAATDRTASLSEAGQLVRFTANTAKTQRMPDDATAAFPIGSWVDYVSTGANDTTFVAAGTATVEGADLTVPRHVVVRATKIAANSWLIGKPIDALPASTNLDTQGMTRSDVSVTPASLAAAAATAPTADRLARYSSTGRLQSFSPSAAADVATKSYVDSAFPRVTSAVFVTSEYTGWFLIQGANLATLTGLPELSTFTFANDYLAESIVGYNTEGAGYDGAWVQRIYLPDGSTGVAKRRVVQRVRYWGPSAWNAWGPWGVYDEFESGGDGAGQAVPPVNSFFTSAWFQGTTTSGLRDRASAKMPLQLMEDISIDQAAFNLTVVAATAGQTATIKLHQLSGTTWTQLAVLGSAIPLTDAAGEKVVSFSPISLLAGLIYGLTVNEEQPYDTATRVTQGNLTGPAYGLGSGYGVEQILPVGANSALIPSNGIPMIKVRRSA